MLKITTVLFNTKFCIMNPIVSSMSHNVRNILNSFCCFCYTIPFFYNNWFQRTPRKKVCWRRSADLGGHFIGLFWPIHCLLYILLKLSFTLLEKLGCTLTCMNHTPNMFWKAPSSKRFSWSFPVSKKWKHASPVSLFDKKNGPKIITKNTKS